ncbi:hypothetical protein EYC80_005206 [Monilinia laxa]|uniref:Uncharacterized protein n=1 Tax=Monilinia laxa TaxID=61186 RepID=A0A5N6KJ85_MONLA|nr:hypothetical protein EYC80_005206 [Monilinia laxa]
MPLTSLEFCADDSILAISLLTFAHSSVLALSLPPRSGPTSNTESIPSIPPVAIRLPSVFSHATRFKLLDIMLRPPFRPLGWTLDTGTSVSTVMSHTSRLPAPSTRENTPGLIGDQAAS